jgi:hypothetical protein
VLQDTIVGTGQEETNSMKKVPPVQRLFAEKEGKASPLNIRICDVRASRAP